MNSSLSLMTEYYPLILEGIKEMKLFVAISTEGLSFDPKTAFRKVKVNLSEKAIDHKWVRPENYHITLNFLGDIDEKFLPIISSSLEEVASKFDSFSLKVVGMGAFPDETRGRVIWVGVQNSVQLQSLQKDCEKILKQLGFDFDDKIFIPHLTVARLRSHRRLGDIISPLAKQRFGNLTVDKITLYESKLQGNYPVYSAVLSFPLGQV